VLLQQKMYLVSLNKHVFTTILLCIGQCYLFRSFWSIFVYNINCFVNIAIISVFTCRYACRPSSLLDNIVNIVNKQSTNSHMQAHTWSMVRL